MIIYAKQIISQINCTLSAVNTLSNGIEFGHETKIFFSFPAGSTAENGKQSQKPKTSRH